MVKAEPSTWIEILRWGALHQPERLVCTFLQDGETEEVHLTYGELDQKARAIGARLQSLGRTANERSWPILQDWSSSQCFSAASTRESLPSRFTPLIRPGRQRLPRRGRRKT